VKENLLYLWWLGDPSQERLVGRLRLLVDASRRSNGVSLEYDDSWLANGFALSEDLPLQRGEALPSEKDSAVGAVDDARPDRWGERVIRHLLKPPR
jgi:serine/threonine-protein kinase HipA